MGHDFGMFQKQQVWMEERQRRGKVIEVKTDWKTRGGRWQKIGPSNFATVCAKLLRCIQVFVSPWTVALQSPLSMGFSRQECWSEWPCPPPGDLPNLGIKPWSLTSPELAGGFFTTNTTWEAQYCTVGPPYPQGMPSKTLWFPETMDSTEPYVDCVFSYTSIPMMKLNL